MDQDVHLNQKETPPLFREISSSPVLVETAMSPSPSDAVSIASSSSSSSSSSSVLHWFRFSKAALFTGWTFSCLSMFHEKIEGTASAFNRFLLKYGLIKSSDVKCSLQILVWRLTLNYRGSVFIFVILTERRLLQFNGQSMKRKILPVSGAVLAASRTTKLPHCVLIFSKCQYERTCLGCCCTQFTSRDTRAWVSRICLSLGLHWIVKFLLLRVLWYLSLPQSLTHDG